MKRSLLMALLFAANGAALAQSSGENPRPARAPLAVPADLEPAVDVGGQRPAANDSAVSDSAVGDSPAPQASSARALDTLDLGTTSITGNQELPKVLYIVPWKRSDLGELVGRPVNTLLDEVLAPVDPEVFERQLQYYESLYGTSAEE